MSRSAGGNPLCFYSLFPQMIHFVYSIREKKHNCFSELGACTDQLMYFRGQSWVDKRRLGEGELGEDVNGQRMLSVKTVHTNGAVLAEQGKIYGRGALDCCKQCRVK